MSNRWPLPARGINRVARELGMNFIVGMRKRSGVFFEMRATAWGVSNIRLLAGFSF